MRALLFVCALLSTGLLSGPVDARERDRSDRPVQVEREDRRDRRDHRDRAADAARRAQLRNGGGRVLSVEPEGSGYRVKVLKDGEVRLHHIEPN